MNRSISTSTRNTFFVVLAIVLTSAAGVTAFFFARSWPIPVTSAVSSANVVASGQRSLDLGAGYRLELNGAEGKIVAPVSIVKPGPQSIDLGAGYRLVLNGAEGKIVAPTRPNTFAKRMDLGAGYVLELNGEYGRIVPPLAAIKVHPAASVSKTMDLGAGYKLVISGENGQIVPPSREIHLQAQTPKVHKEYIGGGYWLETWADGGVIFQKKDRGKLEETAYSLPLPNGWFAIRTLLSAYARMLR